MAKVNGRAKLIFGIISVLLILAGIIKGYTLLGYKADVTQTALEKHCTEDSVRDSATEIRVRATETAVTRIETDIGYIQASQARQEVILESIREEIRAR